MKVHNVNTNKYSQNQKVNFGAQIFHQREIFKSISDTDSRTWDLGQKYEHIKMISNAIDYIKKIGDPDTGISLLQRPVTIEHHNCWYNTRIINKKFPNIAYHNVWENNESFFNMNYLKFFGQTNDALFECIENFEQKFLKYVSNLAKQKPPAVLEMFNIKDEHWIKIADKIKDSSGYFYVGLEKDRKIFEEKYLKNLINRLVK